jgi:hypothetical protein
MGQTVKIQFDPDVLEALEARAAEIHESVSQLVNEAVRARLAEDLEDLAVFDERADEPEVPLDEVLADLRARGRL